MKKLSMVIPLLVLAGSSIAQENMDTPMELPQYKPDPKVIKEALLPPSRFGKLLFDLFEYHVTSEEREALYDVEFWYGGDFNRIWIETEGEHSFKENAGTVERLDLLYARLISPFWDFRAGIGTQFTYNGSSESRKYLTVGFQGLAPYWFEIDANFRIDTDGKTTADLEAEYELLFTQRLILQPRFETMIAFSDIPELSIGSGLTNIELGLRLRYEIRREFAPYIGVSWVSYFGKTKDFVKASGGDATKTNFVVGIRMWF